MRISDWSSDVCSSDLSARLERFLQLCAGDNIQVCNITTPANYFHVLRRQMLRAFRKPLILMTPKSLLRYKLAVSSRDEFLGDSHFVRIKSDMTPPADDKVRRLVLCSGKVAYDLMEARDSGGLGDVSVVRIEQLYPFPGDALSVRLKRMKNQAEEHTPELQSLMRSSYAVLCLKKQRNTPPQTDTITHT